jgi:UDP-N-acetylmuramoyl-tripeptide--D-alanyl-D-alanine ligase
MTLLDSNDVRSGVRVPPTIRLEDLVAATGGRLHGPAPAASFSITGASVDSRRTTPGSVYVALRGERADGHAYVTDAIRAGSVAALVERPVQLADDVRDAPQIIVADPLRALQDLAAWWRARHAVRVVGITGSTGKTIAKEITADVLSRGLVTLRSEGNLNSETGLPMTLLRLEPGDEAAVLEMSMYTVGEIARLAEIARPEVGVVLAVHPTHLERAGSIERIASAKAELPAALPRDGLAVLNADDPRVAAMAELTPAEVRTFGLGPTAEVMATDIVSHGLAGTEFTARAPWGGRRLRSATPGRHLVPHALAALAVADRLGVAMDDAAAALAAGSHADHRMEVVEAASGATLVDDTYNASPVSVAAALDFLAETSLPAGRRRIAVLGDMLELGPDEERLHREVGARAAGSADAIVTVGERGTWIAEGAVTAGAQRVARAADADEAVAVLERAAAPGVGDVVLLKASRGIGLDRAVDLLRARPS